MSEFINPTFNVQSSNQMPSFAECIAMFKRGEESKSKEMEQILREMEEKRHKKDSARQKYLAQKSAKNCKQMKMQAERLEKIIQAELERTRFEIRSKAERKERQRQARANVSLLERALALV